MSPLTVIFFFYWYRNHRDLHSFPTRRSSDLFEPLHEVGRGHDLCAERPDKFEDRKSTRLNSSHSSISYAVFCLKKKNKPISHTPRTTAPARTTSSQHFTVLHSTPH